MAALSFFRSPYYLLVPILMAALAISFTVVLFSNSRFPPSPDSTAPNTSPTPIFTGDSKPTRLFTGKITGAKTGCWSDGVCSLKIDDKWIITEIGGLKAPGPHQEVKGQLIGITFDDDMDKYLGHQVEVYAGETSADNFSLYGDVDYYVKLIR